MHPGGNGKISMMMMKMLRRSSLVFLQCENYRRWEYQKLLQCSFYSSLRRIPHCFNQSLFAFTVQRGIGHKWHRNHNVRLCLKTICSWSPQSICRAGVVDQTWLKNFQWGFQMYWWIILIRQVFSKTTHNRSVYAKFRPVCDIAWTKFALVFIPDRWCDFQSSNRMESLKSLEIDC